MFEDIQKKMQEETEKLRKNFETGVGGFSKKLEEGFGITSKFYSDYLTRQATFTGAMIEAGIENNRNMFKTASVTDVIKSNMDNASEMAMRYAGHNAENVKEFQELQKKLQELAQTQVNEPETETVSAD
jgi:hypothetical protein